jgi:hypothetical protein
MIMPKADRSPMTDIDADTHPRPWGFWATFGWATLAILLSLMIVDVVMRLWRPDIVMLLRASIRLRHDPVGVLLKAPALLYFS